MQLYKKYASILYLLMLFLLYFPCNVFAQDTALSLDKIPVSLSEDSSTLRSILKSITDQQHIYFTVPTDLLEEKYTIRVKNGSVQYVLQFLLGKKKCTWTLDNNIVIIVKPEPQPPEMKPRNTPAVEKITVKGIVMDEQDAPLIGATVKLKGTAIGKNTDLAGRFVLETKDTFPVLVVTFVGYEKLEVKVRNPGSGVVTLRLVTSSQDLDETVITAYGTTLQRFNTASVSIISGREVGGYTGSNPILALQGHVPGLNIDLTSGLPGAAAKILLRGQNSLYNGSDPLFIVNDMPLTTYNQRTNILPFSGSNSNNGGLSSFTWINPADIASIKVLKDADATAIYGSRGGNGVIIITTKGGEQGKLKVNTSFTYGISNVSYMPEMLSTRQYLEMRNEGFRNDGVLPNNIIDSKGFAPDLKIWDTTKNTNWPKLLIGGTAQLTAAHISMSGGNKKTKLLLGGGYNKETSVFPSNLFYSKITSTFSFDHKSLDNKLQLGIHGNYSLETNHLFNAPLTSLHHPSNAPDAFDSENKLKWSAFAENPLAGLLKKYDSKMANTLVNLKGSYNLFHGFWMRLGIGYNARRGEEHAIVPIAAQNPLLLDVITGSSSLATSKMRSYLVEPQLEYSTLIRNSQLVLITGLSYQYMSTDIYAITGEGYTNDALLYSLDLAPFISSKMMEHIVYKYGGPFGRITYTLREKYIINLTGRRDGSSRFSPEHRFGNFGAIGAAWIFTEEPFIKKRIPFSYGKLRASYGVTGSDQIGDYKYLNTWSSSLVNSYQGLPAMAPDGLYNPDYFWERSKKLEIAIEFECFNGALFASIAGFRNRTDNQLVNYRLPGQTGYNNILKNFDATIQNKGLEIVINYDLVKKPFFKLNAGFNLTIPDNSLLRFKDLSTSSYNGTFVIGQSIKVLNKLESQGVNPGTGLFVLKDADGVPGYTIADCRVIGDLDPDYYGGFHVDLEYRGIGIEIAGEFKKQLAPNYLYVTYINNLLPGTMFNQQVLVLDRWQKPGDDARYPKYSASLTGDVYGNKNHIVTSNKAYSDAGYFKLRDLTISYTLKHRTDWKMKFETVRIFCKAQNLFTVTPYKGGDPEIANPIVLPTLRTFAAGIHVAF